MYAVYCTLPLFFRQFFMKLQQLRYILEVYRQNLNVSAAAESLFTSQPGISKQIRLLEEEIGVPIFVRQGRKMAAVTEPGRLILEIAERILRETQNIKKAGDAFSRQNSGLLNIGGLPAPIKYRLPKAIAQFSAHYPQVDISMQSGNAEQMTDALLSAEMDLAILTDVYEFHADLCYLPCGHWQKVLIVPNNHALANREHIDLAQLAECAWVVDEAVKEAQSPIAMAFQAASMPFPRTVLSSADEEVIQTYVAMGLGVGLVSAEAVQARADCHFQIRPLDHLFAPSPLYVVLPRERYLRQFIYDFIELFSPDLNQHAISQWLYRPPEEDFSI